MEDVRKLRVSGGGFAAYTVSAQPLRPGYFGVLVPFAEQVRRNKIEVPVYDPGFVRLERCYIRPYLS
jgi:hypothetical protein